MAVDFVGINTVQHLNRIFQLTNHDFKRSGHARFRRGPPSVSVTELETAGVAVNDSCLKKSVAADATPSFQTPVESVNEGCLKRSVMDVKAVPFQTPVESAVATASFQSPTSSSFVGGSVGGSVSNGRQVSSLGIVAPTPSFSSRKPPLPSSHRKRHSVEMTSASLHGSGRENVSGTGCHCCKRRKSVTKRKVRRIPITGSKVDSIPADDYSWKKYGEKKIHGSPFPRVYYKCNSSKGCPARKCVELSLTDSKMLLVTYDREHRH